MQRAALRLAIERVVEIGLFVDLALAACKIGLHQRLAFAAQGGGYLGEAQFGMILHAPEDAAIVADFRRLDRRDGVARQQDRFFRQALHLVGMERGRIPRGGTSGEQRMVAPRRRRGDPARNSRFQSLGHSPHRASRRRDRDLKPCA